MGGRGEVTGHGSAATVAATMKGDRGENSIVAAVRQISEG
jgi:hypothetical protein